MTEKKQKRVEKERKMVNPIPKFAKNVWSKWNIRGVVLVSLTLQIILIFMAPFRKRSRKRILVFLLWSTYLIADYTANFCVGLISNKYGDKGTPISTINDYLLAFWTPFLLLHLGGPDTITAFALEDNELWLRHLLGLVVQVCLTGYVFLLTLPDNTLWLPTALVFMAGIIKFAERTRSLQLASADNFRQSMVRKPDPGPNYAKLMEEYKSRQEAGLPTEIVKMPEISEFEGFDEPEAFPDGEMNHPKESVNGNATNNEVENEHGDDRPRNTPGPSGSGIKQDAQKEKHHHEEVLSDVKVVKEAHRYFGLFKGLVVDMIFSFHERSNSRTFFLGLTALDTLRVIEVELNFIYQAFYTKASVMSNWVGFCFRFLSIASVVAALVLFASDQKRGCQEFDIKVSYTLLYGAVALDVVSFFMLILSDHSFASFPSLVSQKNDAEEDPETSKGSSTFGFLKHLMENTLKHVTFSAFLKLKKPVWTKEMKIESPTWLKGRSYKILRRPLLFRRWSETISGFNLISYCLNKKQRYYVDKAIDYIGLKEVIEQLKYEQKQQLLQKLWIFIYTEVERKAGDADDVETIQRICSSRGEWVLQEGELNREKLDRLMPYVEVNTVTFDQCLILWHIATDLLFYEDEENKQEEKKEEKKKGQASDIETGSNGGVVHKTDQVARKESEKIAQEDGPHVKKGSDDSFVPNNDPDVEELKDFSKLLSDYLLYLIIMQPKMMSAVRGIAQIRFQDTCVEASNFFSKREVVTELEELKKSNTKTRKALGKNMCNKLLEFIKTLCKKGEAHTKKNEEQTKKSEEAINTGVERVVTKEQKACKKLGEVCVKHEPSAVKGDRSKSLLFDACQLAEVINDLGLKENKWKMIAQVWVELLSYAACNCIPITHVQQLSKGGEFISLVWLLMTHLGLAKQFQIKEGHARAKLIVGEDDQIQNSKRNNM